MLVLNLRLLPASHCGKLWFAPSAVYIESVVGKVAMGQVSITLLHFSHANIIPPMLRTMDSGPVSGRSSVRI
jgi:hypothetical protein